MPAGPPLSPPAPPSAPRVLDPASFVLPTQPAAPVDIAIAVRGLTKRFGPKVAVNDLYLDIPAGSFFGLVGPNGAGKSTTLSMITGLLRPDAGEALIAGRDTWHDPFRAKQLIGVLPENLRLFERLSGREMLEYLGQMREMPTAVVHSRATELLDVLGLTDDAGKLITDYSTGMRKKIGLAAALLHAPDVLFLDEPFESVDPISVRAIRLVLEQYTQSGATIVFSSHVMPIVEELCDRVAIMNLGHLVASGPIEQVRAGRRLEDAFIELVGAEDRVTGALDWLSQRTNSAGADGQ